jgi:hypothetical protein
MFDQCRSKVDEPPSEGHVTCEAFEWFDVGVFERGLALEE